MIKIFDLYGKCIRPEQQIPAYNSKATIELNGIPEGMYLIQINMCKEEYYSKIIKNNRGTDW